LFKVFEKSSPSVFSSDSAETEAQLRTLADAQRHSAAIFKDIDLRLSQIEQTLDIKKLDDALDAQRALQIHEAYTLTSLQEQIDDLRAGWSQHLPAFLNALSTIRAFATEQAEMKVLLQNMLAAAEDKEEKSS